MGLFQPSTWTLLGFVMLLAKTCTCPTLALRRRFPSGLAGYFCELNAVDVV